MSIILSPHAPNRFEPPGQVLEGDAAPRLYWLRTPTRYALQAFESERQARYRQAAREVGVAALDVRGRAGQAELLRQGIETVVAEDQRAELRRIVDRFYEAEAELLAGGRKKLPAELVRQAAQIQEFVVTHYAPFRHCLRDTAIAVEIAADLACRQFLSGAEGVAGVGFDEGGWLTEDGLAAIPVFDRALIHAEVVRLSAPTESEQKN